MYSPSYRGASCNSIKNWLSSVFIPSFLTKATLPFLSKLADKGYEKALKEDKNFLAGLNVFKGQITYKAVADRFGHKYIKPNDVIGA